MHMIFLGGIGLVGAMATSQSRLVRQTILWATGTIAGFMLFLAPGHYAYNLRTKRLKAFPSAVNEFTDRVNTGRAKRNLGYEVFFPSNVSIGDSIDKAFIFYPEILVDHMAYSKVLGSL